MPRHEGRKPNPQHGKDHAKGFSDALEDALKDCDASDRGTWNVAFQIEVDPNPGGVGTYVVILSR